MSTNRAPSLKTLFLRLCDDVSFNLRSTKLQGASYNTNLPHYTARDCVSEVTPSVVGHMLTYIDLPGIICRVLASVALYMHGCL